MSTMIKAGLLALALPMALSAPVLAQDIETPAPAPRGGALVFAELDANGDGSVSLEELEALETARFAAADANGDGTLGRDELLAHATAEMTTRIEARIDRMLERADADGDGAISQAEMEAARDGRRGGPDAERLFGRMDADEDGLVSEAEFDAALERMAERGGQRHSDRRGDRPGGGGRHGGGDRG